MSESTMRKTQAKRARQEAVRQTRYDRVNKPGKNKDSADRPGVMNLRAAADALRLAVGVFLAFQDTEASSAADIEEAMALTPEERAAEIARLEAALRKAQAELDELNQDLPANETTAKAKEANIAEIERELFAVKTAQAVAKALPAGRNADEWRTLLRDAIRAGQRDAIDVVLTILALPSLASGLIRGISGIRSLRGFFSWLFRRKPARPPQQIPWNEYGEGYARRWDRVRRAVAKSDEDIDIDEFERAMAELEEWMNGYTPISPGPPIR